MNEILKEYEKKVNTVAVPIHNLHSKEYEDARDALYLEKFKLSKGFEKLVKLYFEYGIERVNTICYTGSNIHVTEKNMPYLYNCLVTACEILDVKKIPDLYIMQGDINAFTIGAQNPIIIIHNGCLVKLSHEELMFVLGREVGHIKSEHVLYHSIGASIPTIGGLVGSLTLGFGDLITQGLMIAYYDWLRKSEYTADRAGLLACQDYTAGLSAMAKIAGLPKPYYDSFDPQSFLEQAQEFEDMDTSLYNKILKVLSAQSATHPWTVLRAKELDIWYKSEEYGKILNRTSQWLINEEYKLTTTLEELTIKVAQLKSDAQKAKEDADRENLDAGRLKQFLDTAPPNQKAALTKQFNAAIVATTNAINKSKSLDEALEKAIKHLEDTQKAKLQISETINREALVAIETDKTEIPTVLISPED